MLVLGYYINLRGFRVSFLPSGAPTLGGIFILLFRLKNYLFVRFYKIFIGFMVYAIL